MKLACLAAFAALALVHSANFSFFQLQSLSFHCPQALGIGVSERLAVSILHVIAAWNLLDRPWRGEASHQEVHGVSDAATLRGRLLGEIPLPSSPDFPLGVLSEH